MLAVIRMVAGVRALIEARRAGRPANVRLRTGRFVFGVRLASSGERPVQLSLGEGGRLQVPELSVSDAALPILRLASDLLRRLIAADRSQARNLRVSALRDEVRELRKELRAKKARPERLVHRDPERLRAAVARPSTPPASRGPAPPRSLRFDTRWEAEIAGLDAASTFLCGDRLVVAAPRRTVCLGRDEGELIWRNETPASVAFMTGEVLVRATSDGRVSLTSVEDGEVFATRNLAPRVGGPPCGLLAGGRSAPPVVVLAEGSDRLVAIDLRTGDLRWRYGAPVAGRLGLSKTGRILLVTAEDGSVSALDIANGELLWRYLADGSLVSRAVVCGETVLVASGQELAGVELFSGRELWLRRLDVPIAAAPVAATEAWRHLQSALRGG